MRGIVTLFDQKSHLPGFFYTILNDIREVLALKYFSNRRQRLRNKLQHASHFHCCRICITIFRDRKSRLTQLCPHSRRIDVLPFLRGPPILAFQLTKERGRRGLEESHMSQGDMRPGLEYTSLPHHLYRLQLRNDSAEVLAGQRRQLPR
jgi:hypothetical protein